MQNYSKVLIASIEREKKRAGLFLSEGGQGIAA